MVGSDGGGGWRGGEFAEKVAVEGGEAGHGWVGG